MIDGDIFNGACRHAGSQRLDWILDDRGAPACLDGGQAGRAIVQSPGQDDADGAPAEACGGSAEQRIDGGTGMVFLGRARQHDTAFGAQAHHSEVQVRGRHQDAAAFDQVAMARLPYRQNRGARE
jgi:hypothetical protein